jgi:Gpi18-like mannosyltransferase
MQKRDFWFIIKSFLIWRVAITLIAYFAILYIPRFSDNFFGGRLLNYEANPLLWGWANFDGEHYLSIAINGYKDLQQAYFPFYPLLIRLFGGSVVAATLISNISFLVAIVGLYKLIRLDYSEKTAKLAIILLLIFPTSFFFATVYTESLFLALVVWSFFLFRKQKYFSGLVLGTLSSLTRAIGIIPLGLFSYMTYSKYRWGDYLAFFHNQTYFGEHRSSQIILLPQVFYRYAAKIIPNLAWSYPPAVFTTLLEFGIALLFLIVILFSFKRIRLEYWLFLAFGYLLPTLSGSFSSLPRYVVVLFPAFIYIATRFKDIKKSFLIVGLFITSLIAIVAEMMFIRGYFVS